MKSLRAQERSLHTAYGRNQKQTEVKMETSGGKPKGSQWQLNSSQRITARTKISIGRVQNKLDVDSPRDETKGPFWPGGDRAPGRGIKIKNKTGLMLIGRGLRLCIGTNTGTLVRTLIIQDCLCGCFVCPVDAGPSCVPTLGCFLGPSHFVTLQ
jgi:hypothetical protein